MKKTLRFMAVGLAISTVIAGSAFAQTQLPSKVALVDTDAFYKDQDGIKKIDSAYKSIDAVFKSDFTELEAMAKKFEALQTEIQTLQGSPAPIRPETVQAKVDELEKLQRDFKFKQEDVKARYSKKETAVLGPVVADVGEAIGEFARQKGFTLVLDSGKLYQAGLLLYLQDTTDITKEFILFYNNRPAVASVSKPE